MTTHLQKYSKVLHLFGFQVGPFDWLSTHRFGKGPRFYYLLNEVNGAKCAVCWWEVVWGSCYLLASHQQDAVFLSMLHLSENVIQDQKFRPAVMQQLHLISHLQETHTHAHKGRWKWLKQKNIILKQQVYSMGFTLFWHVHLYCSLFPSSFTENLDWYSLEPAQTSTPYHSSVTISRSLYVHVVWSHWVIKFDYDLKKKQNYLSILRSMLLIQSQVCDKNSSNGKWRDHKNKDRRELELCSVVFVCECVCDDVLGVGAISVSRVLYLQA